MDDTNWILDIYPLFPHLPLSLYYFLCSDFLVQILLSLKWDMFNQSDHGLLGYGRQICLSPIAFELVY